MGLSGRGQWKAHRSSDGLLDQADGIPDNCGGPGTGKVHVNLFSHKNEISKILWFFSLHTLTLVLFLAG